MTISIITICYNNLEELLVTCASVDKQTIPPFEHWIIDGSSSPAIRDHLNKNPQPGYRKWISEKDDGIADAFNKGVLRATGDLVNMLNSADYFIDQFVIEKVLGTFREHPGIAWIHSRYRLMRGGIWVVIGKPFEPAKLYRGMRSLAHQSMFVQRSLHDKHGLYDKQLKIAMDYDFVCRIANEPFLFLESPLIVFAPGGTSTTNYRASLEENRRVYLRYGKPSLMLSLWLLRLRLLYELLHSPVGGTLFRLKVWLKLENA